VSGLDAEPVSIELIADQMLEMTLDETGQLLPLEPVKGLN
jgi:hypothetical protein